jgi:hypothetical protein
LIITDNQAFHGGEGGSGAQKRGPSPSPPDTGGANKKTSTPRTSDRSHKTKTTNLNLAQGKKADALRTTTSYFEKGWNAFAQQKDGSMQWIPEHMIERVIHGNRSHIYRDMLGW